MPHSLSGALLHYPEARIRQVANLFTGPLINLIDTIRGDHEQTIGHDSRDRLLRAEWAGDVTENARQITSDFAICLTKNRDEGAAPTICFNTRQIPPLVGEQSRLRHRPDARPARMAQADPF